MRKLLYFFVIALVVFSCKKEETWWETALSAPLVTSSLGIGDLLPDSVYDIDADQKVSLVFNENIFELGIDSLFEIEPDTIQKSFSIAPLFEFTFNPGQTFYSSGETFDFQGIEAQLSLAILKSGIFYLRAENTISGELNIILKIPKATQNGEILEISETIPAADNNGNGVLDKAIDISGYELDLTGTGGFNQLTVAFILKNPDDGEPITAYNTDVVDLELSYSDLEVEYAIGYFGSGTLNIMESSELDILKEYNETVLNLNNATALIEFRNGIGVDIQASIFQLKAFNKISGNGLSLDHSLIGSTIHLSRASYNDGNILASAKTYLLDNSNSNITEWIEVLPDSVKINAHADFNPFGNISNYNDFISDRGYLSCDLNLRIPLQLSLSNLVLRDTTIVKWPGDENYIFQNGVLYLFAKNSFPANMILEFKGLDRFDNVVLDLTSYLDNSTSTGLPGLISGSTDHSLVSSLLKFNLDTHAASQMKEVNKIAIKAKFETENYPQEVLFSANDSLHILISTDINTRFSY